MIWAAHILRIEMKKLLLSLLICVVLFTSCSKNSEKSVQNVVVQPEEQTAKTEVKQVKPVKPEMPRLSVEVTPEMEFFRDGYEIVELEQLADGDTTTYKLKSGLWTTRYLAIDTPETSNGLDPWGLAAKNYVNDLLSNAKEIILEKDPILTGELGSDNGTTDKYNRLLAHVWVDGELLQYKVVEQSLASVAYLYYDYKYNKTLMELESYVRKVDNRRIHNKSDKDPDYDYSDSLYQVDLNSLDNTYLGRRIETSGVVTGVIEGNAYIQSKDGEKALYLYGKNTQFKAFSAIGNEVKVIGRYTIYNGIPEISSFEIAPVKLSENNSIVEKVGGVDLICKDNMSALVRIEGAIVEAIKGNNITISTGEESATLYIDSATKLKAEDLFVVGNKYDITGNVSVYNDNYQLLLRYNTDVWDWN